VLISIWPLQRTSIDKSANKVLELDSLAIALGGGISIEDGGIVTTEDLGDIGQLLLGGNHFDDLGEAEKRRVHHLDQIWDPSFPREKMVNIIEMRGLCHPSLAPRK
jgi:GAF domain-containing protein